MIRIVCILLAVIAYVPGLTFADDSETADRPNILFAIADDWGWPHAGSYGDPVVKTPTFDRLAKEGVLFNHAYISSPSCTPSRGAILTGKYHWQLGEGANLWCVFRSNLAAYPEELEKAGYQTGVSSKGWGPGRVEGNRNIAGHRFKSFDEFIAQRNADKPFCYWLGSSDPHRGFVKGSGKRSGMDLSKIKLFECFPDSEEVRGDVADYYFEVQRFDSLVGRAVKKLEEIGELDNTIIVVTGDHGMPFPRCKSNLYDSGARVPLVVRWPAKVPADRVVDDFVSLVDLAPTFMAAAGLKALPDMSGRNLLGLLGKDKSGRIEAERDHVIAGKERHVPGQEAPNMGGYPCRSIRTHQFLYIKNYASDRWPAGTPNYAKAAITNAWLADCDNGPTKTYIVENKDKDDTHRRSYDLCFGKRPAEELYDVVKDPEQLNNIAGNPEYKSVKQSLADRLQARLKATGDPRANGGGDEFDKFPYLGGAPKHPAAGGKKKPRKKK